MGPHQRLTASNLRRHQFLWTLTRLEGSIVASRRGCGSDTTLARGRVPRRTLDIVAIFNCPIASSQPAPDRNAIGVDDAPRPSETGRSKMTWPPPAAIGWTVRSRPRMTELRRRQPEATCKKGNQTDWALGKNGDVMLVQSWQTCRRRLAATRAIIRHDGSASSNQFLSSALANCLHAVSGRNRASVFRAPCASLAGGISNSSPFLLAMLSNIAYIDCR